MSLTGNPSSSNYRNVNFTSHNLVHSQFLINSLYVYVSDHIIDRCGVHVRQGIPDLGRRSLPTSVLAQWRTLLAERIIAERPRNMSWGSWQRLCLSSSVPPHVR